ncbi:MAG TPA: hypothetical protein VH912_19640 [Streptosporangiaceae bacterium]
MNTERLEALRTSLDADGYLLEVDEDGGRVGVKISATPEACEDCLVPEPIMRGIMSQTLGVPEDSIDLTYPSDAK